MVHTLRAATLFASLLLLAAPPASAQTNKIAGLDVVLSDLGAFQAVGRQGAFPNGVNGLAMATTVCNEGSVTVPWQSPDGNMLEDHPFISFLVVRERNGRFEQISNRSYVKHGFFSTNQPGCSSPCQGGPGSILGLGCSDTYSIGNNGNNYWLAPPEEIDPWLGTWDKFCSYFDRGDPPVSAPADCDGFRSLTSTMALALGPVGNRINVLDADLQDPGGTASFWYQGFYTVRGEPEENRRNNLVSRSFDPSWTGSAWNLNPSGADFVGTVLNRWSGARIESDDNDDDDGRVYVGVTVTGPVNGLYHYEYALHNRDNARGIGALRIPICPDARVLNAGFGDVDDLVGNDWAIAVNPGEIEFSTGDNPLRWNTIYNFWFDSDAAPGSSTALMLDQFDPGAGDASLVVVNDGPSELYNPWLGAGCSSTATPPDLYATGSPPQATLGNATFGLESSGNDANTFTVWLLGFTPGSLNLGSGCTFWMGGLLNVNYFVLTPFVQADGAGVATLPLSIPNDTNFEGVTLFLQTMSFRAAGGPIFSDYDLSDGLGVRVGNNVSGCP